MTPISTAPNKRIKHGEVFAYTPGDPIVHTLQGIQAVSLATTGFFCTLQALREWLKANPAPGRKGAAAKITSQIQKLHDDGLIVNQMARDGLSERANAAGASKLLITADGMKKLRLVKLRSEPIDDEPPSTARPGRCILSFGSSLINRPPLTRPGAEDFRSLPSRSGASTQHYTGSQGMQR